MLFSLGGALATVWRPRARWLPWALAAAGLTALALWDPMWRAGRIDFVLLGLAGYELTIGLTETPGY